MVYVFAEVMPTAGGSDKVALVSEEGAAKMKALLMQMQTSLPAETLARAWGGLTAEKQAALQKAMA